MVSSTCAQENVNQTGASKRELVAACSFMKKVNRRKREEGGQSAGSDVGTCGPLVGSGSLKAVHQRVTASCVDLTVFYFGDCCFPGFSESFLGDGCRSSELLGPEGDTVFLDQPADGFEGGPEVGALGHDVEVLVPEEGDFGGQIAIAGEAAFSEFFPADVEGVEIAGVGAERLPGCFGEEAWAEEIEPLGEAVALRCLEGGLDWLGCCFLGFSGSGEQDFEEFSGFLDGDAELVDGQFGEASEGGFVAREVLEVGGCSLGDAQAEL